MTGHYAYLVERRAALLATSRMSPEARARAMGTKHYQMVAKEHRIVVDCAKPEERTVVSSAPVAVPPVVPEKKIKTVTEEKLEGSLRSDVRSVLKAVVEAWGGVTIGVLIGPDRSKTATRPRFAAERIMRVHLKLRRRDIARALGKRDTTTMLNAERQGDILIADDADWAERYHLAVRLLGASQ